MIVIAFLFVLLLLSLVFKVFSVGVLRPERKLSIASLKRTGALSDSLS